MVQKGLAAGLALAAAATTLGGGCEKEPDAEGNPAACCDAGTNPYQKSCLQAFLSCFDPVCKCVATNEAITWANGAQVTRTTAADITVGEIMKSSKAQCASYVLQQSGGAAKVALTGAAGVLVFTLNADGSQAITCPDGSKESYAPSQFSKQCLPWYDLRCQCPCSGGSASTGSAGSPKGCKVPLWNPGACLPGDRCPCQAGDGICSVGDCHPYFPIAAAGREWTYKVTSSSGEGSATYTTKGIMSGSLVNYDVRKVIKLKDVTTTYDPFTYECSSTAGPLATVRFISKMISKMSEGPAITSSFMPPMVDLPYDMKPGTTWSATSSMRTETALTSPPCNDPLCAKLGGKCKNGKCTLTLDIPVAQTGRVEDPPETITVPAGTFETLRVVTKAGSDEATTWVACSVGIVKSIAPPGMMGPGLTYELVKMTNP